MKFLPQILCACFSLVLSSTSLPQTPRFAANALIIKLRADPAATTPRAARQTIVRISKQAPRAFAIDRIETLFPDSNPKNRSAAQLHNIFKLTLPDGASPEEISAIYRRDPNVEYVQPNYIHQLDAAPNDPLFTDQVALQVVRAEQAWDLQLASPEIIVGVIDTGIDYLHEDLADAVWVNPGEDLDGNGRVDSSDFNGLDDDGNGFTDDLRGWDFTDAPTFPDGGDFFERDNDPADENGHGTSVSGLIGATGDNGKGIAGLAYGCRIMPLRAGTALGLLEEDDVAAALVYAVNNGARIVNMSFGDTVASPLLRDVMAYAYARDCVLVASAGNAATDEIHFPSGFKQTISVGASTAQDEIAPFSNFGNFVDLVAPGVDVLTTFQGNKYRKFGGTSASAPYVSALAALLLSRTPELSPDAVKGLLVSSTDDLGPAGWDDLFSAGRINAEKALQSPYFSFAQITGPELDSGFADGPISIFGTAAGTFLQSYSLLIGSSETDELVELVTGKKRQVIDQHLFDLNVDNFADGVYVLHLVVRNSDNSTIEDKLQFFVDRSPPEFLDVRQIPTLDGDKQSFLVEFDTDDITDASILFRPEGGDTDFQRTPLRFNTKTHRFNFTQGLFTGRLQYYLEARNRAGLLATNDNDGDFFSADLSQAPVGGIPIQDLVVNFAPAFLLEKTTDLNNNGLREVIINEYDSRFNFTAMKILEYSAASFIELAATDSVFIPRDAGDSDGDGLQEILAGRGGRSFIFEAAAPGQIPEQIAWQETELWAARFTDLDRDQKVEILARRDDLFILLENTGDNSYAEVASLPNPTDGQNSTGVPRAAVADFDGDSLLEVLLGDSDGDVYIYESVADDRVQQTWSTRMPLMDTIDYLSQGDYDGDGLPEFVVGCHTGQDLNNESTFDSQRWLYRIFKRSADNSYVPVWEQAFFGVASPANFDSGVSSGDVDNDGTPEVLLNLFPDFYIVDFDESAGEYQTVWHSMPARSNATLVVDFDQDGKNEFYVNSGIRVQSRRVLSDFSGPLTPTGFSAVPLDTNLVRLAWLHPGAPGGFSVARGTLPDKMSPLAQVRTFTFLDSSVVADSTYFYSVTALDPSLSPSASRPTETRRVTPGPKPFVKQAHAVNGGQIEIEFSAEMASSVADQNNYKISGVAPVSAIVHQAGRKATLTMPEKLPPGRHEVLVSNVTDLRGTPLDIGNNSAEFMVQEVLAEPYLVSVQLIAANKLRLEFSQAMDAASAATTSNYEIEPRAAVTLAEPSPADGRLVFLTIDARTPIGPFGIEYLVRVRNVKSRDGIPIRFGNGDTMALVFASQDLDHVFAYPNPFRADTGRDFVTIAGLPVAAVVRILDASGRLLRTLRETDGNGGVDWNLRDRMGAMVASGIYIFHVKADGKSTTGKFAVLR